MMRSLYHCTKCGLVYCFLKRTEATRSACCGAQFESIEIAASAHTYTSAGGEIEGIEVEVTIS
jgi:hypothetical protein